MDSRLFTSSFNSPIMLSILVNYARLPEHVNQDPPKRLGTQPNTASRVFAQRKCTYKR